jgi:hypothetical protein
MDYLGQGSIQTAFTVEDINQKWRAVEYGTIDERGSKHRMPSTQVLDIPVPKMAVS